MSKKSIKWGVVFFVIFIFSFGLAFMINTSTQVFGDSKSRNVEQEEEVTQETAIRRFQIKPRDLFDVNKVRYVKALDGEKITDISSLSDFNAVAKGSVLFARLNSDVVKEQIADDKIRYILPYRFEIADPEDSTVMNLIPVAVVLQGGLRLYPDEMKFKGSVLVGIEDEKDPAASRENLPDPVTFQFAFSEGTTSPEEQKIDHINIPYYPIKLEAMGIPESPSLKILSSFDPQGIDFEIPIVPTKITVSAPSAIPFSLSL